MLRLTNKKFVIFGIQQSGKTYLMKNLLNYFHKPIVFEVHPDYRDTKALYYTPPTCSLVELNNFCGKIKALALKGECDLLIIDEADLFFKNNLDIPPNVLDLVVNHAHYNLAIAFLSRRPQDLPTKIVETCHYTFIFIIEGVNAVDKIKKMHKGMEALLPSLSFEEHNFIIKELGNAPYLANPV